MTQSLIDDVVRLPTDERLELIGVLWDSLDHEHDEDLSPEERAVLDERLAEHYANPDAAEPMEVVMARLRARL